MYNLIVTLQLATLEQENEKTWKEESPTIQDIALDFIDDESRPNPVLEQVSYTYPNIYARPIEQLNRFTESEAVTKVIAFLKFVGKTAMDHNDNSVVENANLFLENLRYIGKKELDTAVNYFAEKTNEDISAGQKVGFYIPPSGRSELYITYRILEQMKRKSSGAYFTFNPNSITQNTDKVCIADDFAISGTRIRSFYTSLVESNPNYHGSIECMLIAAPKTFDSKSISSRERPTVTTFYGIDEYRNSQGKGITIGGKISVTGSHCATDYGFKTNIEEFHDYLEKKVSVSKSQYQLISEEPTIKIETENS